MKYVSRIVLILFASIHVPAFAQSNQVADNIEFQVLKNLWDSTTGIGWTTKTNWPTAGSWPSGATSSQFGTWFGVTVTNGDITSIALNTNNLTGKLPTSIGSLKQLRILRFNDNHLGATIPPTFVNLTKLSELQLAKSGLSGSIPSWLGNLSTLTTLHLGLNGLTGTVPSSIGKLTHIVYLYLNNNQLSGSLPDVFTGLTTLREFSVANNQFTGPLPSTLNHATGMVAFTATQNKFSGPIPSTYSNLTQLVYFYVDQNELSGELPSFIGNWAHAYAVMVRGNRFSGTVPASIINCTSLGLLNVSKNRLTGAFPSVPASVSFIDGSDNYFTSLPGSLTSNPGLIQAYFNNNDLASIPDFGTYSNRTNLLLNLQNNRLDFSKLEPHAGKGIKTLIQVPQKNVNDYPAVTMSSGNALVIIARPIGAGTTLTWEKLGSNGTTWATVTNDQDVVPNSYTRNTATQADQGTYRWKTTSNIVTGTAIYSDPIQVKTAQAFTLDNWAFQYKYDGRRRMVQKKVPGADWVYMVYDSRDRLVMTQDGEQRKVNKWMATKYDMLNRPVITSIYTHTGYLSQPGMDSLVSKTNFGETFTGSGPLWGYTNAVFPTTNLELLTVTNYDNYDFLGDISDFGYKSDQLINQYTYNNTPDASFPRVMGLVTGRRTKTLGVAPYWMLSANYYDDKGRVLQTISETYKAGVDRVTSVYDFTGKVMQQRTTHTVSNIMWQNVALMREEGNKIVRTPGGSTYGSSGASSVQTISASTGGWAEGTVTETAGGANRYWGLSDNDSDRQPNTIDYAFYMNGTGLQIVENGVAKLTVSTGEVTGDRLKIKRTGNTIKYYKNDVHLYTSATTSLAALRIDVAMGSNNSTILNLSLSTSKETHSVRRYFSYDHTGRLLETWHQIDEQDSVLLAKNEYNELGQLIDKKLHSTNNTSFRQSIDYMYNIRGWLTSANGVSITNEDTDSRGDLFGMDLFYNETTNSPGGIGMYNGNISSMGWVSKSEGVQKGYVFGYDPMNRLTGAQFRTKASTAWQSAPSFAEDNLVYDLNGNIKRLRRTDKLGQVMDDLSYDYGSSEKSSNRLVKVTDSGDVLNGFVDDVKQVADDYAYDNNGNMIADNNKSIGVEYNHLNLPQKVTKTTGEQIQYIYDSDGRKVSQVVLNASGVQTKSTDYEGEYVYENDTLKFINTEEGRVIMTAPQQEYQYHLKDHLGNVRMTFTTKDKIQTAMATLETEKATTEGGEFLNYDKVRRVNHPVFDHTYDGTPPPNGTTYATRLNGSANERIGLAKSLSVMPGDTLKVEVFAKYYEPLAGPSLGAFATMMAAITGGAPPSGTIVDGSGYASNWTTTVPGSGLPDKSNENGVLPKAYLNWLVFDGDYNLVLSKSGYKRITTAAKEDSTNVPHERLAPAGPIVIDRAGYAYIYLSNENEVPVEVYWDDFKVEHIKSPIVQSQDYYPFGLQYNSYTRESSLNNKSNLFQSQEHVDDLALNWDSFKWRNHQPDIGRFFNVDPLSEKYDYNSPYAFSENHVTTHVELEGLEKAEINHEGFEGILDRSAKTEVTIERKGADVNVFGHDRDGTVVTSTTISLPSKGKQSEVSDKSAKTIGEVAMSVSDKNVRVSSLRRNAGDQARAMMQNLTGTGKGQGIVAQRNLYAGRPGAQVVSTFAKYKALQGIAATFGGSVRNGQIQNVLTGKVAELGVQNVTNHASADPNLNVIDVAPSSVENHAGFMNAADNHPSVNRFIRYPHDPGMHFEIRNP